MNPLLGPIFSIIDKIIPDRNKAQEYKMKVEELERNHQLEELKVESSLLSSQNEVNKEEAKHTSLFVAGWRPFVGWVGGISIAYQFLVYPLLTWAWAILEAYNKIPEGAKYPPSLDSSTLMTLITGMLGIAGMRTYEKYKGVSK